MLLRVISSKHRSPSFVAAKKKITFFPAARRAPLRLVFVFNKDDDDDVAKDEQRPGFLLEETLKLNRREEEDKEEEVIKVFCSLLYYFCVF